jgi:hypothetical protein
MAVYLYAFYPGRLPSKAALTRCFEELGFPLTFDREAGSLDTSTGGLPMRLRGEDTGFDLMTLSIVGDPEFADIKIDPRLTHCAICQFGAGEEGCAAALCFAVAVAKLVNGALYDPQSGQLATLDETIAWAREVIEEARLRPISQGTRPRDVRYYLRSLLQQRSDLALVGDLLFVRPIRHLVRGASLRRSSYKYSLQVSGGFIPVYDRESGTGRPIEGLKFEVWQPHFEPLLMAMLADEIFDRTGRITTLADFATEQSHRYARRGFPEITSMVLAGELDRAAAYVEEVERKRGSEVTAYVEEIEHKRWIEGKAKHPARVHWESLVKDVEATCAEYHAREIKTVKEMKLDRFWEPAPFPIELPAARRTREAAEPPFLTTPWPARPEWLWQQLPERPGEVRYAQTLLRRDGNIRLLVALTPEQAEERHRALERYDLVARLPDGLLVLVALSTSWDPNRPQDYRPAEPEEPSIHVVVEGQSHIGFGDIPASSYKRGRAAFESFGAHPKTGRTWEWTLDFDRNIKSSRDYRAEKGVFAEVALTRSERDLATFPKPAFGEYMLVAERLRELLRVTGYGEIT